MRGVPTAIVLIGLSLAASCGGGPPSAPRELPAGAFHIALVVIDACRPDRMGCYGYELPTTPVIDALAADPDAVLFRRHYVQGAWTKASTASLFTGLWVHQHGVVLGHLETQRTGEWREYTTQVLPGEHVTLAERLKAAGYETFGAVKSQHLVEEYGFVQGFDAYDSPEQTRKDETRVERFLEMARATNGKFFGYLHLNACHHPFAETERDAEWMDRYGFGYDEEARKAAGIDFTTPQISHDIKHGLVDLEEEDVRFLRLVYDAQFRWTDRDLVGVLLAGLKDAGLYDDTLIILTADHGEELYEHEGYAHGHALWEEVIRVPLIVKFPKGRKPDALGGEVDALTRSVDILPALLALLGERAPEGIAGVPIFHGLFADFAIAETKREWALIRDGHKLIAGDGPVRLYDLASDPHERVDLARSSPQTVAAMTARMEEIQAAGAARAVPAPVIETTLSEEAEENLRALGYLD